MTLLYFLRKKIAHLQHPSMAAVMDHFDNLHPPEINSLRDKSSHCHGNVHLPPTRNLRFQGSFTKSADSSPSFFTQRLDGDDLWVCHGFLKNWPGRAEMDYSRIITYDIFIFQCSKLKAQKPQSQSLHVFLLSHHNQALQERLLKTPLLSWFKPLTCEIRKVDLTGCMTLVTLFHNGTEESKFLSVLGNVWGHIQVHNFKTTKHIFLTHPVQKANLLSRIFTNTKKISQGWGLLTLEVQSCAHVDTSTQLSR